MTIKTFFTITIMLFLLSACATQAGLVKTESDISTLRADVKAAKAGVQEMQKRVDMLDANMKGTVDLQKVMADTGARMDQLTTDLQILQGKVEENNFRLSEFAQKFDDKIYKIGELNARIEELEAKVKAITEKGTAPAQSEKDKKPEAKALEPSEAYRAAKDDYDKKNFDLAIAGFQNYLKQFPDTSQVDSAQYWIGECYYAKNESGKAIEAFSRVIKNYPKSEKVPGAKFKIGLSYLNEKNNAKAREYFNKVIKEHPKSKEATLAKEKLRKMGK
jgi:tol-pal system protein YbgF